MLSLKTTIAIIEFGCEMSLNFVFRYASQINFILFTMIMMFSFHFPFELLTSLDVFSGVNF